jgi:hypothetical protein
MTIDLNYWRKRLWNIRAERRNIESVLYAQPGATRVIEQYDILCSRLMEQIDNEQVHREDEEEVK